MSSDPGLSSFTATSRSTTPPRSTSGRKTAWAPGSVRAAALGRWPAGRFSPFVKAGVLAWEEDGERITIAGPVPLSADGTDLFLGAGVDVDLPHRFAVRADWEHYTFAETSSDGFWASLLYRF